MLRYLPVLASVASGPVFAAVQTSGSSSAWTPLFGFMAVIIAAAFVIIRLGRSAKTGRLNVQVIGGASLGGRERIAIVDVAGQRLVIGITPSSITTLTTLPVEPLDRDQQGAQMQNSFLNIYQRYVSRKNTKQ